MKKLSQIMLFACLSAGNLFATIDDTLYIYSGATIHVGNGTVINQGSLLVRNGIITAVRQPSENSQKDQGPVKVTDLSGKHVYPGIIACNTLLGLSEVDAVRATRDYREVGRNNANVSALIAYNTDSKITPTVLANGVLFAQVVPQGGFMPGQSSVVKLAGWNWEDAAYAANSGMHLNWPSQQYYVANPQILEEQRKNTEKSLAEISLFFEQAYNYCSQAKPDKLNLKYEAMREVFQGKRKLFIHAEDAKSMISAVTFAERYKLRPVLVGAAECFLVTGFLKEHNIPVILSRTHSLPQRDDDPADQSYALPALLKKEGILFAISDVNTWEQRNVIFQAGTAAGYGLSKEEALQAVTLDAARILGIDKTTGSLEEGKEAHFIVSEGDLLDYRTSVVRQAFLYGKPLNLYNQQQALYEKYKNKYGLPD